MTADFANGRSLVWLSSYPKSGNTWLRAMLSVLTDPETPLDLNRLPFGMDLFDRQLLDDFAGISTATMTTRELIPYQAQLFAMASQQGTRPEFAKTHAAAITANCGTRLFDAGAAAGAIYLVRNPLDVVVSYAHHGAYSLEDTIARMRDAEGTLHQWHDKSGSNLPQLMGGWSDHVASWIDDCEFPVLLVRYEDMLGDTATTLENVAQFCGLEVGCDAIRSAVKRCEFGSLRANEEAEGFSEKPSANRSFFRSGRSGDGSNILSKEQISRIVEDHGAIMQRLNYATP